MCHKRLRCVLHLARWIGKTLKEKEKKERVIHTRISPSLEEELKKKADGLGVSVSNLVRNILTNTFELVDTIVSDTAQLARSARGEKPGQPASGQPAPSVAGTTPQVLGWQRLVLAVNAVCAQCNEIIPKGSDGALAITDIPETGQRSMSCISCLEGIGDDTGESDGDDEK